MKFQPIFNILHTKHKKYLTIFFVAVLILPFLPQTAAAAQIDFGQARFDSAVSILPTNTKIVVNQVLNFSDTVTLRGVASMTGSDRTLGGMQILGVRLVAHRDFSQCGTTLVEGVTYKTCTIGSLIATSIITDLLANDTRLFNFSVSPRDRNIAQANVSSDSGTENTLQVAALVILANNTSVLYAASPPVEIKYKVFDATPPQDALAVPQGTTSGTLAPTTGTGAGGTANRYTIDEVGFTVTTDAKIYRAVANQGALVTIRTTADSNPRLKVGDQIVTNTIPQVYSTIDKFYVATGGAGTTSFCGALTCSFDKETAHVPSLPLNLDLVLNVDNYVTGTSFPIVKDFIVFPVLDIPSFTPNPVPDIPFANSPVTIRLEIYPDQAALQAAATAAGDTDGDPLRDGGSGSATTGGSLGATAGDQFFGTLLSIVNTIIGFIVALARWIVWTIGTLIVVPLLETTLTIRAAEIADFILVGWTVVRDVVNMLFILVLIIIGFGTMLRIESYNYKKLLVNLIMMALLVNFSLVIGRIIIQFADIIQFTFLPEGKGINGVQALFQNLVTVHAGSFGDGIRAFKFTTAGALGATFSIIFQFIFELGAVLTFAALAIFMLIRTVALWILLILSPFAYALAVLPTTAGLAKKWWSSFLKYAFFAPIIAFFLMLTSALYKNGLKIIPPNSVMGKDLSGYTDLIDYFNKNTTLTSKSVLVLAIIYIVILAFLWAGLIVTRQMGIFGANAIVGLAEKGLKAPLAGGWWATRKLTGAFAGFGAQKILEKYGKEIRPQVWIQGWKESREINKIRREQRGMLKAEGRSTLANPVAFFQRYWGKGAFHAIKGDNQRGQKLREEAREELEAAENAHAAGTISDADYQIRTQNAEAKARAGFAMIHPADYFTQRKTREAVNKEKATILGETWQELFDLAEGARREKHADRYLALFEKTAETYNENEVVNHTRYTRDMTAEESADKKAHKKGQFFDQGWAGWENYRKLILEEQLGLSGQASMRFLADVGDIAASKNHTGVWRLYDTKHGQYRHKPLDEWETEIRIEKGKMTAQKKLGEFNRLAGHDEIPSLNYDVDGVRIALTQENEIDDTVNLIDNVKFMLNRGQFGSSKARALAFAPNMARLEKYARSHLDNALQYGAVDLKGRNITEADGKTQKQWTKMEEALYTLGELRKFGEAQYLPGEMEKHMSVLEDLLKADVLADYHRERIRKAGYTRTAGGVTV